MDLLGFSTRIIASLAVAGGILEGVRQAQEAKRRTALGIARIEARQGGNAEGGSVHESRNSS